MGELSFCRVYAGSIRVGEELYNPERGVVVKIGQVFSLQGHEREPMPMVGPGDIAVMAKLKDCHTGNTLSSLERKVRLPRLAYPKPNIHATLISKRQGDEDRLAEGLTTLHEEDPTFLFGNNVETNELVVSGQGELHLEVIKERLRRRFNLEVEYVEPRVAFRETMRVATEAR